MLSQAAVLEHDGCPMQPGHLGQRFWTPLQMMYPEWLGQFGGCGLQPGELQLSTVPSLHVTLQSASGCGPGMSASGSAAMGSVAFVAASHADSVISVDSKAGTGPVSAQHSTITADSTRCRICMTVSLKRERPSTSAHARPGITGRQRLNEY